MNEETCQTDLDINRLEAEAMNALKAVKIAQLANNVIAQQKDSDKAEYENELSILAQEQQ
jgi:hypothetical protein